jgi:hypothetical protein
MVSEEFKSEATKIRQFLKRRDEATRRASRGLLNPDDSCLLSGWDACTTLALAFTALVTPFEIGFFPSESPGWNMTSTELSWFYANRVVDIIFLTDVFLQFRIMYPAPTATDARTHSASPEAADVAALPSDTHVRQTRRASMHTIVSNRSNVLYVASGRKIAERYVYSAWFVLDIVSLVPSIAELALKGIMSDQAAAAGEGSDQPQRGRGANIIIMLRMVRVARLVKLVRLVKYKRIVPCHRLAPHTSHPPTPHNHSTACAAPSPPPVARSAATVAARRTSCSGAPRERERDPSLCLRSCEPKADPHPNFCVALVVAVHAPRLAHLDFL